MLASGAKSDTLAGQAGGYGGLRCTHSPESVSNKTGTERGEGLWGTEVSAEPGTSGAPGPGSGGGRPQVNALLGRAPQQVPLAHLASRCLCQSGPPPRPGDPPPVVAGRTPQGCSRGSLGVTVGLGLISPSSRMGRTPQHTSLPSGGSLSGTEHIYLGPRPGCQELICVLDCEGSEARPLVGHGARKGPRTP